MNLHNQLDPISRRSFCERWASTALGVTVLHGETGSVCNSLTKLHKAIVTVNLSASCMLPPIYE